MKWYWWALLATGAGALLNRKRVMSNLQNIALGKNFNLSEFVITSTGLDNIPGPQEIENLRALVTNILQPLRDYIGKPIHITSGYRSPAVNKMIGGSSTSQHTKGQAADFHIEGMSNQQIIDAIRKLKLPYDQVIDEQLRGKKWIHVSYSPNGRLQWLTARDGANGATEYKTVKYG
jgi:zinc D-Ala-D-Ala carboxypeptidase